jgi:transcriptional regulator with XRE-family HTH domain
LPVLNINKAITAGNRADFHTASAFFPRYGRFFSGETAMPKQVYERIRLFRQLKNWTQEETAEKLDMSPSGYGGIERGDTDVSLSRLERIAEVLEIDLTDLFDSDKKQVFNFGGTHSNHQQTWHSNLSPEQVQLKYEFEKQQLIIEKLQQENGYLKEIVELLKKGKTE